MNETMNVQAIDHVTLIVRNLENSGEFFRNVLGMQQVERPEFSFDGSWFQAGTTQIHLILEHDRSTPAGPGLENKPENNRTHHVAFRVDDVPACAKKIATMNVSVVAKPALRPDGFWQMFIQDPDGHVIELCSKA